MKFCLLISSFLPNCYIFPKTLQIPDLILGTPNYILAELQNWYEDSIVGQELEDLGSNFYCHYVGV